MGSRLKAIVKNVASAVAQPTIPTAPAAPAGPAPLVFNNPEREQE